MRSVLALLLLCAPLCRAQIGAGTAAQNTLAESVTLPDSRSQEIQQLRTELARLSARLDALESGNSANAATPPAPLTSPAVPSSLNTASIAAQPPRSTPLSAGPTAQPPVSTSAIIEPVTPVAQPQPSSSQVQAASTLTSALPSVLPGGATLNYTFDGYYEFNANQPPGRVNDLRAYDVLSNTISINQADVIFALEPDLSKGRRYGLRLDLQFGQATDTLQGNSTNEPRPDVYRNIFQAYGTYVVPVGKGLTVDFGKWASSLGIEGNYTKDQMNYTRSFYFYFLPFYHAGVRASYHVNDKLAVNYWVINGTNQSEPTNGYKDELFGFALTPTKTITWTSNYYLGQEHPDTAPATNCTVPVQPGLCLTPIHPAPNGKLHIFDNYVSWQVRPKLTLAAEGDYFIQREWANAGPGESSAPSHVSGGAAYAQYQLTSRGALAARGEYLSDRSGLFSGRSQALKEGTATYKYTLADGLDAFVEFRRDWTNIPYFTTHSPGSLSNHQNITTLGLVWWYGGKQGSW